MASRRLISRFSMMPSFYLLFTSPFTPIRCHPPPSETIRPLSTLSHIHPLPLLYTHGRPFRLPPLQSFALKHAHIPLQSAMISGSSWPTTLKVMLTSCFPFQETIAPYTSQPESWSASAKETKGAAVDEMRAAKSMSEKSPPAHNESFGKVEEKVGSAVGCEGMVDEGKQRVA